MPQLEEIEIVTHSIDHNGQMKPMRGMTPRGLIRMLRECDQDAVIALAVMLPNGTTLWAGVQGGMTDFDGTGKCVVLCDNNITRRMSGG